jgi:hypothetical protein
MVEVRILVVHPLNEFRLDHDREFRIAIVVSADRAKADAGRQVCELVLLLLRL